jgi:uncharacterized protein
MSAPAGQVRRADREIGRDEVDEALRRLKVGHFASVGADGEPYVVPNLFVYERGKIHLHTASDGHFRRNVAAQPRLCFEAAEMGEVYPYGEFRCDLSTSYVSVIGFGAVRIETDPAEKARFFDRFVAKYADPRWDQPKSFYPRLDQVTVYCLTLERVTGKRLLLPPLAEQWPALNRTKSPGAKAPGK